jgi:hypothetical protein
MAESWIEVVERVFKENKAKNPKYKLKHAMKDAKKYYKSQPVEEPYKKYRKTAAKRMNKTRKAKYGTRKNIYK